MGPKGQALWSTPAIVGVSFAFQHALYRSILFACDKYEVELPKPTDELCTEDDCVRYDIFAFSIVSLVAFLGCSVGSFLASPATQTPAQRLFAVDPYVRWLTAWNVAYQVWDFYISLSISEFCTPIMMTHHVVAGTIATLVLYGQCAGYYPLLYFGFSEVSSIFLVGLDAAKNFPSENPTFRFISQDISGPMFAILFTYYRVWRWWIVTEQLRKDVREFPKQWVPRLCWYVAYPMGCLQLYWWGLILKEVYATIAG